MLRSPRCLPPLIAAQMLVLKSETRSTALYNIGVLQADHSQVLIEIRLDPGTRTNVGTSLLGATGNSVTNILRSV